MSLTAEERALRRTMITATDSRTLAGLDAKTALDIYISKIDPAALDDDADPELVPAHDDDEADAAPALVIGNYLEPLALKFLAAHLGKPIVKGTTERSRAFPWLGATVDGNVFKDADELAVHGASWERSRVGIAEAKVVGLSQAWRWRDGVPDRVLVQCTKQMVVTGFVTMPVVALIGTQPRFYVVERNDSLANALIEQDTAFWRDHVVLQRPPLPEPNDKGRRALRELYPRVKGAILKAGPLVEEIAVNYFEARRRAEEAERKLAELEIAMKIAIGEHSGILGDGWKATWLERKPRVSWKDAFEALAQKTGESVELDKFRGDPNRTFRCVPKE